MDRGLEPINLCAFGSVNRIFRDLGMFLERHFRCGLNHLGHHADGQCGWY